ncbi:hypothetical protein OG223_52110 [Streptomyces sp. NBC_01478]|uniref:hypothetical protein n=1 Tax=Streptomyces sp. NBC_01478 TaxID=2903882 RepID=UPI002E357F6D|nr:hypothetical protein [Streptomyces sp. NBC_01478]
MRLYVPLVPKIAAPLPAVPAEAPVRVMLLRESVGDPLTTKMRDVPPPSRVMFPPPSMLVSCVMVLKLVIGMVAAPPQLNVTVPPAASAAVSAASVQLAGVPVPTVAVAARASTAASPSVARMNTPAMPARAIDRPLVSGPRRLTAASGPTM